MNKAIFFLVSFLLIDVSSLSARDIRVHADDGRGKVADVFVGGNDVAINAGIAGGGGGSDVEVNDNLMVNEISDSDIMNSAIGLAVNAVDSTVVVSDNTNINTIENSNIENSLVGMGVNALDGSSVRVENNSNVNEIRNSQITNSVVGTVINAR